MATSDSFEFKREPRTASEEGGIQDSSDLSVWGNLKAGWNQGWNQDADAQSPSTISDAMSEAGSSTYSKADQDRSETIASKQSQLLRSKGLGTRFGEWERIGKDLKYYLRKPVLVRGEFTEKADKMLQEGRCPKIVRDMVEKLDNWPGAGRETFWLWGTENERYNEWQVKHDNIFAAEYYASYPVLSGPASPTRCCYCCDKFLIANHGVKAVKIKLDDLFVSAERCSICSLVLRSCIDTVGEDGCIDLYRTWESLRAGSGGRRLLRLSADPVLDAAMHKKHNTPISRPISSHDRKSRFNLLRAWMGQCDKFHSCMERRNTTFFPTRVLDVGGLEDMDFAPGWLRLISSAERRSNDYIALSHRWGDLTDAQKMFCTSQDNLGTRRKGFHVAELPKTFQDAIKVVRAIGHRYLWVDSLCIIQSGDKGEDWGREVAQMQNVFSQAYCVIAATAASNSYSGFLDERMHAQVESIRVCGGTDKQFCISTDIDDYDTDVSNAAINSRAWVMQEAVLARRTVHFTSNQMYWECGKGVYCENLTRLKSFPRGKWFTMDPEFPIRLLQQPFNDAVLDCLNWMFEDYSKRSVTIVEDRPIAVSGLETRITEVLLCESRFCTLERFLHRNLLWMPVGKGSRIRYSSAIPSWSWLSYSGSIEFENAENFAFELNTNITFHRERKEALNTDLAVFVGCTLELEDGRCILRDDARIAKGVLRFDIEDAEKLESLHCIVVARVTGGDIWDQMARKAMQPIPKVPNGAVSGLRKLEAEDEPWLVLAVVPTGRSNEHRRVGIGSVCSDCVLKVQDHVQLV